MIISPDYKKELEKQIVEAGLKALESDAITTEDLPNIAGFVLEGIGKVYTHDDLIVFLEELSQRWAFYGSLVTIEKGKVEEEGRVQTTDNIQELIKAGQINEALTMARNATQ